jgi:beta-phosphoglucomutase-like phosphatase (HAD superfamily)
MQYLQDIPEGIPMAPHVIETLTELTRHGAVLSLVSNNPIQRALTAMRFSANGQGDALAACFGTRYFEAGDIQKPKPDVYLKAIMQTSAVIEDSFAVEDSVTGAQSAIAAGLKTFAFTGFADNPMELKAKLLQIGCMDVFNDWSAFPALLARYLTARTANMDV